jgi:hypothetical protein
MATATQSAHKKELDPKQRNSTSRHFEDALWEKIVASVAVKTREARSHWD